MKNAFRHAALLIYLNKFGFNGVYRTNMSGEFNISWGKLKKVPEIDRASFKAFASAFKRASISNVGFEKALSRAGRGCVVYLDPPYSPARPDSASFTSYLGKFGREEHEALVNAVKAAVKRGATCIISNHATAETRALYHEARIIEFEVVRSVSARASGRKTARELLAIFTP